MNTGKSIKDKLFDNLTYDHYTSGFGYINMQNDYAIDVSHQARGAIVGSLNNLLIILFREICPPSRS